MTESKTIPMTPEQIAYRAITEQDGFNFLFGFGKISKKQHEEALGELKKELKGYTVIMGKTDVR